MTKLPLTEGNKAMTKGERMLLKFIAGYIVHIKGLDQEQRKEFTECIDQINREDREKKALGSW